jgi:hypothetical protein
LTTEERGKEGGVEREREREERARKSRWGREGRERDKFY